MDNCACMEGSHNCCCAGHSHMEKACDCSFSHSHPDCHCHNRHEEYHSSIHNDSRDFDKDYYEQRYNQLVLDREEMERNFARERRERQAAEEKFQKESRERTLYEERLADLNGKLEHYDGDLNLLRNENGFLRSQFDSLRNVINSRVNIESSSVTSPNVTVGHSDFDLITSTDSESYKHEISVLANENELFKQLIDIINNQSREQLEDVSEKHVVENSWQTDTEKTRLQEENSKLKSQVRELQRGQRELQSHLEEINQDLEEKNRKMKKDAAQLEEDLESKIIYCQDLERQLFQVSSEYQEEMQKMEIKIESEVLKKTQIQEEITALENTVHRLELERIEMVAKLDELYNSENEIILARNELEVRFSTEMNELQVRLEDEIRSKLELSQEMTVLMNEFIDLRNKSTQMEEMYVSEIQALQINLGAVMGDDAVLHGPGNNMIANNMSYSLPQQPNSNNSSFGQRVPQVGGMSQHTNDLQGQLNSEIQKREVLERENKDLLYKMKSILSNDISPDELDNFHVNQYSSCSNDDVSNIDDSSESRKKVRALQSKVDELTKECESLRRSSKKRKEAENKNRELADELEELSSERDGMLRKQKSLVKEVDKASSSLQDLADRNRKLIKEIDTASRKIRDMEDAFRQERNTLIRSFDREKVLEVSDFKRKIEDLEDRLKDKKRENEMLEEKIRELEDDIDEMRSMDYELPHVAQRNIEQRSTKESHSARTSTFKTGPSRVSGRTGTTHSASDLKQKTRDLEMVLKEKENDHLKDLEDQRKQLRDEFEKEKQSLRQIYEEEKRNLFGWYSGNQQIGGAVLPGSVASQSIHGVSSIPGIVNPQVGQLGPVNTTHVSSVAVPSQQLSIAQQPNVPQQGFQTGSVQQSFVSPQTQYSTSTSQGQAVGIPVMQQGAIPGVVGQPISRLAPHQPMQIVQQPSNHLQSHVVGSYGIQNAVYPSSLPANNSQIAQFNETINRLQQEINRLNIDKENMGKRMKELEGMMGYRSGGGNIKNRSQSNQGQPRVHFQVGEVSNPRGNQTVGSDTATGLITSNSSTHYEQSGGDVYQSDSREIYSCDNNDYDYEGSLDSRLQDTMKKLVDEHREHSDELRRQMKLQRDTHEREKSLLIKENQKLLSSIKCLQKEIHALKHDKENVLQKLQRERRECNSREERIKEEITNIRKEYEIKIKQESEKSTKTIQGLHNKISVYDSRIRDIDLKFREEIALMENRHSQERNQLEIQLRETDNQVRSKLETQYQVKLKTEKERYEKTLKDLRKEIQCLQEQRKEIQLRLTQDAHSSRSHALNETFTSSNKTQVHYKRLQVEFENRYAQEKRSFEETIRDLQKEIKELEKEKSDIKASYKDEMSEMEQRFEREKTRLEERHRRERDELKRSLDMLHLSDQNFVSFNGFSHNEIFDTKHLTIQKKNATLESKNNLLENDIALLKGRIRDLESRQTKIIAATNNKFVGLDSNVIARSLSHSDLRCISSNKKLISQECRSSVKGLSRDDMNIYHGSSTNLETSQIGTGNYQGSTGFSGPRTGMSGGSGARSLGIAHMPSTGILYSGIGFGAGSRIASERMTVNGSNLGSQSSAILKSGGLYGGSSMTGLRSGLSASTGLLPGYGAGMGSSMMFNRCADSCSGNVTARGVGSGILGASAVGAGSSGLTMNNGGVIGTGNSSGIMMGSGIVGGGSGLTMKSGGVMGTGNSSGMMMGTGMVGGGSGQANTGMGGFGSRLIVGNGAGIGSGQSGLSAGGLNFGMMCGYGNGMSSSSRGGTGFQSNNAIGSGFGNTGGGVGLSYGTGMANGLINGSSLSARHAQGYIGSTSGCSGDACHHGNAQQMNSSFVAGNESAANSGLSCQNKISSSELNANSRGSSGNENSRITSTKS